MDVSTRLDAIPDLSIIFDSARVTGNDDLSIHTNDNCYPEAKVIVQSLGVSKKDPCFFEQSSVRG